jgi:mRNA interferase MazF
MQSWHNEKIKISKNIEIPFFREWQVWYINMWINIGFEENWKNKDFSRPVLILKKFSKDTFLWIPTTTIKKEWKFYDNIWELNWKQNYLLLSQIRLYSSKRLLSNIWWISKSKLIEIKEKIKKLIE